jgi:hypothetical protein
MSLASAGTERIQQSYDQLMEPEHSCVNPYNLVSAFLTLGSVQNGEGYKIFGSTTSGVEGPQLLARGSKSDGPGVTLSLATLNTYHYISIATNPGARHLGTNGVVRSSESLT